MSEVIAATGVNVLEATRGGGLDGLSVPCGGVCSSASYHIHTASETLNYSRRYAKTSC